MLKNVKNYNLAAGDKRQVGRALAWLANVWI